MALVGALLCGGHADAQSWWKLEEYRILGAGQESITVSAVTIDLRRSTLRIIAPSLEFATKDLRLYSVRTLAGTLASDQRYRTREWIVANAGFSSHRVEIPLGLFVSGGSLRSTLSREESPSPVRSPELGNFRWSGVLCQLRDGGKWDIIPAAKYQDGMCTHAVQSGPMLVGPDGRPGVAEDEPQRARPFHRLAVCVREPASLVLVATHERIHLLPLATWLAGPGGPGCRAALNLSGDTSAGIAIGSPASRPARFIGIGTFPVPTVLLAERNR
jgi:uncharacterized protein YigE (DUF2233 family)